MFKSEGLFQEIPCPLGEKCTLLNCIFLHNEQPLSTKEVDKETQPSTQKSQLAQGNGDPPAKRQRIDNVPTPDVEMVETRSSSRNSSFHSLPISKKPSNASAKSKESTTSSKGTLAVNGTKASRESIPETARKPISPPPTQRTPSNALSSTKKRLPPDSPTPKRVRVEPKAEALNPRLLAKTPAAHAVRLKLLQLLHEHMERLNRELMTSKDTYWKEEIGLSKQGVITLALDEEERAAKSNAAVYANVLKLRIVALKKMTLETWKAERIKALNARKEAEKRAEYIKKHKLPANYQGPRPVDLFTGLTPEEEISMLPQFFSSQTGLSEHGYVTSPPSAAEIEATRRGLESAGGWENCDRCNTRFQVFPGRRELDGALTTGGKCTYHWGRQRRPEKVIGQQTQGDKQFTCCGQELGTKGCVSAETHVFKASAPTRLELVLPFERTPRKGPSPISGEAVCFDCEMGYTSLGMELIRLTATRWPTKEEVVDVLVRPIGEVLDLNSRFSGVWPDDFTNALPWDGQSDMSTDPKKGLKRKKPPDDSDEEPSEPLRIVPSPSAARGLLFKYLTTTTPLIGHAIENDLNAVRIVHPTIIDTVLLFPHPAGLPIRYGLKMLSKKHLNIEIQTGGERGHDSKEDARAAGDLVKRRVQEKWRSMEIEGWTAKDGVFYPPEEKKGGI